MKNFKTLLILAAVAVIGMTSCSKEKRAGKDLEGSWDMTSYTIDGEEQIGVQFGIDAGEYEFGEYKDGEGDVETTLTVLGGLKLTIDEKYSLNDKGEEITFTTDSTSYTYILTIDGDKATMEGDEDGDMVEIEIEKQ